MNKIAANITNQVKRFLTQGHARSIKAKKNILASLLIKGGNIAIGFMLVPMTIHYLDETKYGIWLTLSSIIGWFSLADIGLGNGLRNKFAASLAKGEYELAKIYVSTTYAIVSAIIGAIYILFAIASQFIDWSVVLNTPPEMAAELKSVVMVVFSFFCLRFIFQLIGKILIADQRPAINNSFNFIGNCLALIVIYILTQTTQGSLLYISIALSAMPVIVLLGASIILFLGDYKAYRPSVKHVKREYFDSLASLGGKFFLIQIASMVLFTTDNMIITQILGPDQVTSYNIVYKYFHLIPVAFGIIVTPFWSAITEAYTKKEFDWIKNVINKSMKVWAGFVVLMIIMIFLANDFYLLWIGKDLNIPRSLTVVMGIYTAMLTFNSIFVMFINGVGKLRLQIYTAIFSISANIPLSYLFAIPMEMGLAGVILATCVSIALSLTLRPIQYYKIINGKATGIWNK